MASRGGYDGGPSAGGKIRRRASSRAAAASPYARPAPVPAPAPAPAPAAPSGGGEGSGWLSRLIAGSASRLFSVFGKPAPLPLDAPPSRPESLAAEPSQLESLDAPTSPPPPPLEDDASEEEENGGAIANNTNNPGNSTKEGDDILRTSDGYGVMDLEELLKKRTYTRSEFEYLTELLRSRTTGSKSMKSEAGNFNQTHSSEKEHGSRDLPVDFSIRTYNVADQVASPAELAKAYMGSRSSKGSPLRLRLHDPSSLPYKSTEASPSQIAKPPTLSLLPSSRFHDSTPTDHPGINYMTPNRSAIYKISPSPYFKSVSSWDLSRNVSSSYQTANNVHTFGRQVLKRKSTSLNNESVSVGPIRKMRQKYNRVSPLLQTRPGYRGYLGIRASRLDEDSEHLTQTQKRRCLDKVTVGTQVDNTSHDKNFGQAPAQSTEMAAKILKQLDTLVPSQKGTPLETRQKHENAMDAGDPISEKRESLAHASIDTKTDGVTSDESSVLKRKSASEIISPKDSLEVDKVLKRKSASEIISPKDSLEVDNCSQDTNIALHQANDKIEGGKSLTPEHTSNSFGITNKEKPPAFPPRSHAPPNLVLSNEIERNKILTSSNGFSFPVPAALGVQSQAPPTPTLATPPLLPIEKQQYSAVSSAPVTLAESVSRMSKPVSGEGTIANKCVKKSNAENPPVPRSSGQVVSFTSNHVFSVVKSNPATLSNGQAHTSCCTPSTASIPHLSFQPGFQTPSTSPQQYGNTEAKAESFITAPFGMQSSSTESSLPSSNTGGTGSSSTSLKIFAATAAQSVTVPSLASSGSGNSGAPFSFSSQYGTTASFSEHVKSKVASSESMLMPGNHRAQSGNSSLLFTQSAESNLNVTSSEKSNVGSSSIFANPPFGSAPSICSNSSSVCSFGVSSGCTSVTTTSTPSFSAQASAFGSSTSLSASPIFGSNLTTTAPPTFGLPNTASASSQFSSTSSPIYSFTSASPTVPNQSSTTPIFSNASPAVGLHVGTGQMNGGRMIGDGNQSFLAASPFSLPSSSPSTPVFSTPGTQFASTTSASPGFFQFAQQSQASSGGFSMGTGGGNDKSGRRIIRVKRKK